MTRRRPDLIDLQYRRPSPWRRLVGQYEAPIAAILAAIALIAILIVITELLLGGVE